MTANVRVELPAHLCLLAGARREVRLTLETPVTLRTLLDALEAAYPMLRGTIRDQVTAHRRPFIRFFAEGQDLSHVSVDDSLPASVESGIEPVMVIGAIAGG
jgi:molybdopterin synthase sulfur carrier subunit